MTRKKTPAPKPGSGKGLERSLCKRDHPYSLHGYFDSAGQLRCRQCTIAGQRRYDALKRETK